MRCEPPTPKAGNQLAKSKLPFDSVLPTTHTRTHSRCGWNEMKHAKGRFGTAARKRQSAKEANEMNVERSYRNIEKCRSDAARWI